MYLAINRHGAQLSYQIRQSYLDEKSGHYRHRLVFNLGGDPARHFTLLEGEIPVFNQALLDAVSNHGGDDPDSQLEELLWRFLPRETRERFSRFRTSRTPPLHAVQDEERVAIREQLHLFDRRRLYYLYYGAIDQSRLWTMRDKICRPLLARSRDEIEYRFLAMEQRLKPDNFRDYTYAIFNLQRFFSETFASYLPEGVSQEKIADNLVEELCRLNRDSAFWRQEVNHTGLHQHLIRYLIMFFDYVPRNRTYQEEFVRQFINQHRQVRWPTPAPNLDSEELADIFAISASELATLDRQQLTRLYRQRALILHPDHGGDHDRFVKLTTAYEVMLRRKPKS